MFMLHTVVLLICIRIFLQSATAHNAIHEPYIIGGQPATLGQIPWQASLRINDQHTCGGSVITEKWVISAAHCFLGANVEKLSVAVGFISISSPGPSQQIVRVLQFFIHEGYTQITDENDIAMVELATLISFNYFVQPIPLPKENFIPTGMGRVSGWGTTETSSTSDVLLWVDVPILDDNFCRELLGSLIYDSMLCAGYEEGGKDACTGDSGGPLTCQEASVIVLCGIVSRGLGCAEPDRPGIYTETSYFLDWIAATIKG